MSRIRSKIPVRREEVSPDMSLLSKKEGPEGVGCPRIVQALRETLKKVKFKYHIALNFRRIKLSSLLSVSGE